MPDRTDSQLAVEEGYSTDALEPAAGYRLSKDWVRYRGPFGGEGWQHVQTGEVRYTDDPPSEVSGEGQTQTTLPGEGFELVGLDLDPP